MDEGQRGRRSGGAVLTCSQNAHDETVLAWGKGRRLGASRAEVGEKVARVED